LKGDLERTAKEKKKVKEAISEGRAKGSEESVGQEIDMLKMKRDRL
jgi:hypothetical protein